MKPDPGPPGECPLRLPKPNPDLRSVADGLRELAFEPDPSPRRLTNEDVRDGRSGSPKMGAD